MGQAESNSTWIGRVRQGLKKGLGVEDIAVITGMDVEAVRNEVEILRASGELKKIYGVRP